MIEVAQTGEFSDSGVVEGSRVDAGLFGLLYDRHHAALYRYAYRRVGPEMADDLVAETFLVAFARRHRFDPARGEARAWLFGILTKEISHHHRREKARLRAVARACQSEATDDAGEQALADTDARATRGALAAAVAQLSRGDRDVLLLIAWGGLSYAEAAQALDIPIGTVRSRLNRARRKVRADLGGDDPTRLIEESP